MIVVSCLLWDVCCFSVCCRCLFIVVCCVLFDGDCRLLFVVYRCGSLFAFCCLLVDVGVVVFLCVVFLSLLFVVVACFL